MKLTLFCVFLYFLPLSLPQHYYFSAWLKHEFSTSIWRYSLDYPKTKHWSFISQQFYYWNALKMTNILSFIIFIFVAHMFEFIIENLTRKDHYSSLVLISKTIGLSLSDDVNIFSPIARSLIIIIWIYWFTPERALRICQGWWVIKVKQYSEKFLM